MVGYEQDVFNEIIVIAVYLCYALRNAPGGRKYQKQQYLADLHKYQQCSGQYVI